MESSQEVKTDSTVINPCPKCKSKDITIISLAKIQVICNKCDHKGPSHALGARLDRYMYAIEDWNHRLNCEFEEV